MLFTRSMRRKLAVVLALALLPWVLFVGASWRGLRSYRTTLQDLEVAVANAPSRERLIAKISGLMEPLVYRLPEEDQPRELRQKAADWQYELFKERVGGAYTEVDEFAEKWATLSSDLNSMPGQECTTTQFLRDLQHDLRTEFADGAAILKDLDQPNRRERHIAEMLEVLARMIRQIDSTPDPAYRLSDRLQEAHNSYQIHVAWLYGVGVCSLMALMIAALWIYRFILWPIQSLHKGVQRIAQGDLDYRLKTNTKCELSILAAAFNDMAERIAGDHRDKERRIEEGIQQLILSERMANLGMLSTGVAHEINNPLMGIANAAAELKYILRDNEEHLSEQDRTDAEHALQVISGQTKNCQEITRKLQLFGQGKKGEDRNLYDLTAVVQEVVSLVRMLKRFPDREIVLHQADPYRAWVDAGEIRQVILNIVVNALQATGKGGRLDIAFKESPDLIEVAFTDNGCGMTEDQLKQIFVPFFTTKEVGQGTGLGLSLSRSIVLNHQGTLEASSPGKDRGSTFVLRLPKTAQAAKLHRAA